MSRFRRDFDAMLPLTKCAARSCLLLRTTNQKQADAQLSVFGMPFENFKGKIVAKFRLTLVMTLRDDDGSKVEKSKCI